MLLVEDDPLIRLATEALLAGCGCRVVAVGDGDQALAALAGQSFDLLFVDAQLPTISGLELIRLVRAESPALRVVLASGYCDLPLAGDPAMVDVVLLPKPYSTEAVQRVLSPANDPLGALP